MAPTEAAVAQLFAAAASGKLKLVKKYILNDGLNVNLETNRGRTALDLAAMHGHVEVAKFLVANGGCLNPNWRYRIDPALHTTLRNTMDAVKQARIVSVGGPLPPVARARRLPKVNVGDRVQNGYSASEVVAATFAEDEDAVDNEDEADCIDPAAAFSDAVNFLAELAPTVPRTTITELLACFGGDIDRTATELLASLPPAATSTSDEEDEANEDAPSSVDATADWDVLAVNDASDVDDASDAVIDDQGADLTSHTGALSTSGEDSDWDAVDDMADGHDGLAGAIKPLPAPTARVGAAAAGLPQLLPAVPLPAPVRAASPDTLDGDLDSWADNDSDFGGAHTPSTVGQAGLSSQFDIVDADADLPQFEDLGAASLWATRTLSLSATGISIGMVIAGASTVAQSEIVIVDVLDASSLPDVSGSSTPVRAASPAPAKVLYSQMAAAPHGLGMIAVPRLRAPLAAAATIRRPVITASSPLARHVRTASAGDDADVDDAIHVPDADAAAMSIGEAVHEVYKDSGGRLPRANPKTQKHYKSSRYHTPSQARARSREHMAVV